MAIKRNEVEIKNFIKEIENATDPQLVLAREIIEQKMKEELTPDDKDNIEEMLSETEGYLQECLTNIRTSRAILGNS